MVIRIGQNEPNKFYVGTTPVTKVYRGSTQVWPTTIVTGTVGRESGAVYHALLGADNPTMEDIDGGQAMTAVNITPVMRSLHTDNYYALQIPDSSKRIETAVTETADLTVVVVHKRPTGQYERYTIMDNVVGSTRSWRLLTNYNENKVIHQVSAGNYSGGAHPIEANEWYFTALSLRVDGQVTALTGDYVTSYVNDVKTDQRANLNTLTPLTIGGGDDAFSSAFDIAEVIVFDSYKDAAELEVILQRSHARLRSRGVYVRLPAHLGSSYIWEDPFQDTRSLTMIGTSFSRTAITQVDDPQEGVADEGALRTELTGAPSGNTPQDIRFGWELEPNCTYRCSFILGYNTAGGWEIKGGTDDLEDAFFKFNASGGSRGEYRRTFTTGEGDNFLRVKISTGATEGSIREIHLLRLENVTEPIAPILLEPSNPPAPILSAGGVYYVDNLNGSLDGDGSKNNPFKLCPQEPYPNTTINLLSDYRGGIVLHSGGAAGAPVVLNLRGYTVDGSENLGTATKDTAAGRGNDRYLVNYPKSNKPPYGVDIYQDSVLLALAQYPQPANKYKVNVANEWIELQSNKVIGTTLADSTLSELQAIAPLDDGETFVRLHGAANAFHVTRIVAGSYKASNSSGVPQVTLEPYTNDDKTVGKYAVINHESGMTREGVFRKQADGRITLRSAAGVNAETATFITSKASTGISIRSDYIYVDGDDGSGGKSEISGFVNSPVEVVGDVHHCKIQNLRLDKNIGNGGAIQFDGHAEHQIVSDIQIGTNTSDSPGIGAEFVKNAIFARITMQNVYGTQATLGNSQAWLFVDIAASTRGHANGFRAYSGAGGCHLIYCTSDGQTRPMALQSNRDPHYVVGCRFQHGVGLGLWGPREDRRYDGRIRERGGFTILNSALPDLGITVHSALYTIGMNMANNILDSASNALWPDQDENTITGSLRYSVIGASVTASGSGYSIGEIVSWGALKLYVMAVNGSGGITRFSIENDCQQPQDTLPADGASTSSSGGGSGATFTKEEVVQSTPVNNTANVFLVDTGGKEADPTVESAAATGNILAYREGYDYNDFFRNKSSKDLRRPTVSDFDFSSRARTVTHDLPAELKAMISGWPQGGLQFDYIGPYNANNEFEIRSDQLTFDF